MESTAKKLEPSEKYQSKTTKEKVEITYTDELIIGICSPIGSDSNKVIAQITARLKDYDYEVELIKLSNFIKEYFPKKSELIAGKTSAYSDLMYKIAGGDYLRKTYKNNSILVELAIKKIREDRGEEETTEIKGRRKCYIIDSLKNTEELKLLQSIYGEIFYLFSVFSPEEERKLNLLHKELSMSEVDEIVLTDEYENNEHGQNVRDTFVNGDIFIRISNSNVSGLQKNIERYFHLIFDSQIITPTSHEIAMHHAKSAAGNSACLSRQVGATITDEQGVVIARGWNDVPKFGGNLYNDLDSNSSRCKDNGYCYNVKHRNDIFDEIELQIDTIIREKLSGHLHLAVHESEEKSKIMEIIKKSDFKNIIEYSRSIHAEMHAIIIGSQMTNSKMVGGNLYCTTYPCHNCARHIILAGIKNIYYIEPYKKSLGMTLHHDALTEDESEKNKVRILPYDGVSPDKYLNFFSMKDERKEKNGKLIAKNIRTAIPKKRKSLQAIPTLENQAVHALYECGLIQQEVHDEVNNT